MRLTGARVYSRPTPVPKMPPGLVELMEGLTKDVLKNNPTEVYEFCAEHMRKLLEIRDGPTNEKPLSLDQKISRAQEKVRKRAELRRRKFDSDLQLKSEKTNDDLQVTEKISQVVDDNILQSIIKPIHNDLTQHSEIEITYEPNDKSTDLLNIDTAADAKQILATPKIAENDVTQTSVNVDDLERDNVNDRPSEVSNDDHLRQPQENGEDELKLSKLGSNPQTTEVLEKLEAGDVEVENSKADTKLLNGLNSNESADKINSDSKTVANEVTVVTKSEDSIVAFVGDSYPVAEEKSEEIQTVSVTALTESNKKYEHDINEDTTKNENETVFIVETKENDSIKIIQTNINADTAELTENKENFISEESKEHIDEAVQREHDTKIEIEDTNEIEESTADLEKVMNEAIENTKRKDSSADDSLKYNIVFNDESDASEGSNLVSNKISLSGHVKESDENTLIEIKDTIISKQPVETKAEQSNIDQDDVEHSAKILNESSSNTLVDNADENINKTSKNDNSNTMDLETAAVTIQKVFRNFLFKSRASTFDELVNEENNSSDDDDKKDDVFLPSNNLNKERRTLGLSRMDTVLQTVNEEKSLSLSTDDSSLSSAATIIQAHVRGFLLRNKLHSGISASKNSLGVSNGPSTSLDGDSDQNKSKTILNIHIVPEGGNYLSRDESMITSMDLSLDGSPPSSVNLHPLGYNKSERRKQLKREDAVQSVTPPSNNSGKLSEDVDSIKELPTTEQDPTANQEQNTTEVSLLKDDSQQDTEVGSLETTPTTSLTVETVVEIEKISNSEIMSSPEPNTDTSEKTKKNLTKQSSDEMDVVTPFKENSPSEDAKLMHSGEFHDTALPTKVSRSDTPVVSEFKNVLVYFLLWNDS